MQAQTKSRLLAALGVFLACSCWISAPLLFGNIMGESFSEDPTEQARIAASRQLWTNVLLTSWLLGLAASSAIAGVTVRTNRILAFLTWSVLFAFIVVAVSWLN
jgi:hypothetical protein